MKLPFIPALGLALLSPLVSAQEIKLTASDGDDYDQFGCSVAISGAMAIVGAKEDYSFSQGSYCGSAYDWDTARKAHGE